MNIKAIFFIPVFLLIYSISSAQYTDFDISKYKLPDIKLSTLDFRFDLDHSIANSKIDAFETIHQDESGRNFGGYFNAFLSHYRNKTNYQGDHAVQVDVSPDYSKEQVNDNVNKDNEFRFLIAVRSSNRFYNSSGNFFEVVPTASYIYNNSFNSSATMSQKQGTGTYSISAPVSVGHGRIEPVEDARLAVYILDELSKNGRLSEKPSDAKIMELASEISKIKRKRFFDSRIRRIEELQTIDSFLVANNIVSSADIVYFTRLADQWAYASGPQRNSGFSVNLGINDLFSLSNTRNEQTSEFAGTSIVKNTINRYVVGAFSTLQYSEPVNLYWQSDLSLGISYDYEITRNTTGSYERQNSHFIRPSVSYSIKFLPNSRTSIGLFAGGYYRYGSGKLQSPDPGEHLISHTFYPNTSFDMYYYISPQLRLQVYWNLYYSLTKQDRESENELLNSRLRYSMISNTFSLTLTYSLF